MRLPTNLPLVVYTDRAALRAIRPHLFARGRLLNTLASLRALAIFPPTAYLIAKQRPVTQQHRLFRTTSCLSKKGGKASRDERPTTVPKSKESKDAPAEDPFDLSVLGNDIAVALERLKNDIFKLKAGGRFNPETIENLRVQPDKKNGQTVKLNDLAQVIRKGRTVQIFVGEQDHVKPVVSAVQASPLSLTPQPDPTGVNSLLLLLNIPPPTAESRKAAITDATKAGEKAITSIRDARGKHQKKLRSMQVNKTARPDHLKKAGTQMEKLVENSSKELKKVVDNAKKVLESG